MEITIIWINITIKISKICLVSFCPLMFFCLRYSSPEDNQIKNIFILSYSWNIVFPSLTIWFTLLKDDGFMHLWKIYHLVFNEESWERLEITRQLKYIELHVKNDYVDIYTFYREQGLLYCGWVFYWVV